MVSKVLTKFLQSAVAQYTANQTRNIGANPFSFRQVHWVLLHALHNTRDKLLYVPSKGAKHWLEVLLKDTNVTTETENPHSADQKHQSLSALNHSTTTRHVNIENTRTK